MTDFENSIVSAIRDCIDRHTYCDWDESEGLYCCEIYADYRDEADNKSVCEWCKSKTPFDRFYEDLQEWYFDYSASCEEDILSTLRHHWDSPISYEDNAEFIEDWVRNHLYFNYPDEHFLKQRICVDILVDTGDGNYDYVLNDIYPHYGGRYGEPVHEKASVLWLIRQQGYGKRMLNRALRHEEYSGSVLMESIRTELHNCASHMNALTFFVEMTVQQLLELQETMESEPERSLVLDKSAACGLYDVWSGAGSLLEIQLEKDVVLPLKYISTALPDGGRGYSVANVYAMCSSFWTPTMKQIL